MRTGQLDPASGRFLSPDPLPRTAATPPISSYAYADDRPTVNIDPLGLGPVTAGQPLPRVLGVSGVSGPMPPWTRPGP